MINHGKIHSNTIPPEIEITDDYVFIASNVVPYTKTIDEYTISGYEYDYAQYTKNEYIGLLAEKSAKIEELEEELAAAKILLGVE